LDVDTDVSEEHVASYSGSNLKVEADAFWVLTLCSLDVDTDVSEEYGASIFRV
jgi:hypothetical protein